MSTCAHVERPFVTKAKHKTFAKMAKKNLDVLDEMYSAVQSANESKEIIEKLRPQAEEAVKELIKQRGFPVNFTGSIPYHGFKIVVSRPKSYTWEQNTQISDTALDYYKSLHAMCERLNNDLKKRRAEMKGVAESLRISYPASESIKLGFRIAFV